MKSVALGLALALVATGVLAGAMLPALFMQFACMYDPAHILRYHILPIPGVVVAGVIGAWVARHAFRRQSPRRPDR